MNNSSKKINGIKCNYRLATISFSVLLGLTACNQSSNKMSEKANDEKKQQSEAIVIIQSKQETNARVNDAIQADVQTRRRLAPVSYAAQPQGLMLSNVMISK